MHFVKKAIGGAYLRRQLLTLYDDDATTGPFSPVWPPGRNKVSDGRTGTRWLLILLNSSVRDGNNQYRAHTPWHTSCRILLTLVFPGHPSPLVSLYSKCRRSSRTGETLWFQAIREETHRRFLPSMQIVNTVRWRCNYHRGTMWPSLAPRAKQDGGWSHGGLVRAIASEIP